MSLSLTQRVALTEATKLLYDYLPGSSQWQNQVTFGTVANRVGIPEFWQGGSKMPAINTLLELTLDRKPYLFNRLITEIVSAGIRYRRNKENPINSDDIDRLNGSLLSAGVKIPELWEPAFVSSLRVENQELARQRVEAIKAGIKNAERTSLRSTKLEELKERLYLLHSELSPQLAGIAFEKILSELFNLFGLLPRGPFRVTGEQIDGSIEFDHDVYLVEAKWTKDAVGEAELLIFRGKIEGKSTFSRGVFISLNGVTSAGNEAIRIGKQPNFFIINGHDLAKVLNEEIDLVDFLRRRRRLLADKGLMVVPFSELDH